MHKLLEKIQLARVEGTIISSQLPVGSWLEVLANNATIADAILDRMVNTSHIFELKGESMRK